MDKVEPERETKMFISVATAVIKLPREWMLLVKTWNEDLHSVLCFVVLDSGGEKVLSDPLL